MTVLPTTTVPPQTRRLPYLDNLRTSLVAWIIAAHGLVSYSAVGGWAYDEVAETRVNPTFEVILISLVGVSGLFVIGTLFFISGLLAPSSLGRRGAGPYVRERAERLGVPLVLSAFVVWPLSLWIAYRAAGYDVSPRWIFENRDPFLDSGAMWFAEVLLVFTAGYAAIWALHRPRRTLLTPRLLIVAGLLITLGNFLVRLEFSARGGQPGDLHVWQWPQCLVMFGLGTMAGGYRWLDDIDITLVSRCRTIALATTAALPVAAFAAGITDDFAREVQPFLGGWTWQSLIASAAEAVVVLSYTVWLIGAAKKHLGSDSVGPGSVASGFVGRHRREAFAAFFLQGPVLLLLATSLRPLDIPAEIKALTVATIGVVASFWIGRLLIDHTILRKVF